MYLWEEACTISKQTIYEYEHKMNTVSCSNLFARGHYFKLSKLNNNIYVTMHIIIKNKHRIFNVYITRACL